MTKKEAQQKLYLMWEAGQLPANFTEDHSEYNRALEQLMKYGYVQWEDFF